MDIWLNQPTKEHICEEANDHILLKKDKEGNVIGIENTSYPHSPRHRWKYPSK